MRWGSRESATRNSTSACVSMSGLPGSGMRPASWERSSGMRKELHRRLGKLAARQIDTGPLSIRVVQVLRPDMPEADQDRWLVTAEGCVLDLLVRERAR